MSSETSMADNCTTVRNPKKRSRNPCLEEYTRSARGSSQIPLTNDDNYLNYLNSFYIDFDFDPRTIEVVEEEIVSGDGTTVIEWRILSQHYTVSYKGSRVLTPIKTFSGCSLNPDLLAALAEQDHGCTTPSPIDMCSVPLALHQRDVLCSGVTGDALKARVFLLPLLMRILRIHWIGESSCYTMEVPPRYFIHPETIFTKIHGHIYQIMWHTIIILPQCLNRSRKLGKERIECAQTAALPLPSVGDCS